MLRNDYKSAQKASVDSDNTSRPDRIYSTSQNDVEPFEFNERVVTVFPDMIGRSVPGYWLATELTGVVCNRFYEPGTRIYDLGCSLGAASWTIQHYLGDRVSEIIAIDNSKPMIEKFQQNLRKPAMKRSHCNCRGPKL